MTREPEIALVLSAESWVDDLHRHCADHGGARVRCLVLDPAVALDEDFDILVTGERWPAPTRPFVDALHARGRRVLVVGDPERGADLAARLGVDGLVATTGAPLAIVDAALHLLPAAAAAPDGRSASAMTDAGLVDDGRTPGSQAAPVPAPFVVVGGPWGAGSTEVALALAACCVRSGDRTVVVDADTVTPSVAARLGLPLEPNLCTAVDAAVYGLGAVPGALFDLGDGWPVVLVGAPNRRSGGALSGADVVAVGDVLARRFHPVLFDISAGGRSESDGDVSGALLARATAVVAVGAANPVGVVRLVEWLDGVRSIAADVPIHLVMNRAPAARTRRAELAGELQREARIAGLTFVPTDPRVDDAAWTAALVERGPFAKALATVHRDVTAGLCGAGAQRVPDLATERADVG